MGRAAWICVVAVTSACTDAHIVRGDAGAREGGLDADAPLDTGLPDTGVDACNPRRPPRPRVEDAGTLDGSRDGGAPLDAGADGGPPLDAAPGDAAAGAAVFFAMRRFYLETPEPWADIGYDLDNSCAPTCATAMDSFTTNGIDNSFGVTGIFGFIANAVRDDSCMEGTGCGQRHLDRLMDDGLVNLVFEVSGWNGLADDDDVLVRMHQSFCAAAVPDGGTPSARCDPQVDRPGWMRRDYFYADSTVATVPIAGYVAARTIVLNVPNHAFLLSFPRGSVDLALVDTRITLELSPAGDRVTRGIIAGRWPKTELNAILRRINICNPIGIGGAMVFIDMRADISDAPASDGDGRVCSALSLGLRFEADLVAGLGGTVPPPAVSICGMVIGGDAGM